MIGHKHRQEQWIARSLIQSRLIPFPESPNLIHSNSRTHQFFKNIIFEQLSFLPSVSRVEAFYFWNLWHGDLSVCWNLWLVTKKRGESFFFESGVLARMTR